MAVTDRRIIEQLDIKIGRNGDWFHEGVRIARPDLVKLFASVLQRHDDGSYWLETPVETGRIEVEDVPFLIVELNQQESGREQSLDLRTNVDRWFAFDGSHPLRFGSSEEVQGPVPYVMVDRGLEARLATNVYYQLVELTEVDSNGQYGIWSHGWFHVLGPPE